MWPKWAGLLLVVLVLSAAQATSSDEEEWNLFSVLPSALPGRDYRHASSIAVSGDGLYLFLGEVRSTEDITTTKTEDTVNKAGLVSFFKRTGKEYEFMMQLMRRDAEPNDKFGSALSLSPDNKVLAVRSENRIHMFFATRNVSDLYEEYGRVAVTHALDQRGSFYEDCPFDMLTKRVYWVERQRLDNVLYGTYLSLGNDMLIVTGEQDSNVFMYRLNASGVFEKVEGKICCDDALTTSSRILGAVSLGAEWVFVSIKTDTSPNGEVRVFQRNMSIVLDDVEDASELWHLAQTLKSSDMYVHSFGWRIATGGGVLLISLQNVAMKSINVGVFTLHSGQSPWVKLQDLNEGLFADAHGYPRSAAVSADGTLIASGAPMDKKGMVYIYRRPNNGTDTKFVRVAKSRAQPIPGARPLRYGAAVAVYTLPKKKDSNGDVEKEELNEAILVGAPLSDAGCHNRSGLVYVISHEPTIAPHLPNLTGLDCLAEKPRKPVHIPFYLTAADVMLLSVAAVVLLAIGTSVLTICGLRKWRAEADQVAFGCVCWSLGFAITVGFALGMAVPALQMYSFPPFQETLCRVVRLGDPSDHTPDCASPFLVAFYVDGRTTAPTSAELVDIDPHHHHVDHVDVAKKKKEKPASNETVAQVIVSPLSCTGYPCYMGPKSAFHYRPSKWMYDSKFKPEAGHTMKCWFDPRNSSRVQTCPYTQPNKWDNEEFTFSIGFGFGFGCTFGLSFMMVLYGVLFTARHRHKKGPAADPEAEEAFIPPQQSSGRSGRRKKKKHSRDGHSSGYGSHTDPIDTGHDEENPQQQYDGHGYGSSYSSAGHMSRQSSHVGSQAQALPVGSYPNNRVTSPLPPYSQVHTDKESRTGYESGGRGGAGYDSSGRGTPSHRHTPKYGQQPQPYTHTRGQLPAYDDPYAAHQQHAHDHEKEAPSPHSQQSRRQGNAGGGYVSGGDRRSDYEPAYGDQSHGHPHGAGSQISRQSSQTSMPGSLRSSGPQMKRTPTQSALPPQPPRHAGDGGPRLREGSENSSVSTPQGSYINNQMTPRKHAPPAREGSQASNGSQGSGNTPRFQHQHDPAQQGGAPHFARQQSASQFQLPPSIHSPQVRNIDINGGGGDYVANGAPPRATGFHQGHPAGTAGDEQQQQQVRRTVVGDRRGRPMQILPPSDDADNGGAVRSPNAESGQGNAGNTNIPAATNNNVNNNNNNAAGTEKTPPAGQTRTRRGSL